MSTPPGSVDLRGRSVFLSASVPFGERAHPGGFDADEIVDCAVALLRAIFDAGARLVFGGHPSINPLVLQVASEVRSSSSQTPLVDLYLSGYFADRFPPEVVRLAEGVAELHVIDAGSDRTESLERMRAAMFDSSNPFAGAVFVGGMDGIVDEYELFGAAHPGLPRCAVGAPGGASGDLARRHSVGPDELDDLLRASRRYPFVAHAVMTHFAARSR